MAIIACLGWGSLIWNPRELPIQRKWHEDGPFLNIEFARQSSDGRITLVVIDGEQSAPVRALWAVMDIQNLDDAREALKRREGAKKSEHIGIWQTGDKPPTSIPAISNWSINRGIDAVVWTALPPKFDGKDRIPSAEEVVSYLRGLRGVQRDNAERYVRLTPRQIDTPYRRSIEAELGWTAID